MTKISWHSTENIVGKSVLNSNSRCQVQRGHRYSQSAYTTQLSRLNRIEVDETIVTSGPRVRVVNGGRMKSRMGQPGVTASKLKSAISAIISKSWKVRQTITPGCRRYNLASTV